MNNVKEEVILRILAQESPKSELRLKRSYMNLFVISGKWLGVFWKYFNNSGLLGIFMDCGLITKKLRFLFANFPG
jgi:hypothetical protein